MKRYIITAAIAVVSLFLARSVGAQEIVFQVTPTPTAIEMRSLVTAFDLGGLGFNEDCMECWEATCEGIPEETCEEGDGPYHAGDDSATNCPSAMEGAIWAGCEHDAPRQMTHTDPHEGFCSNHSPTCPLLPAEPVVDAVASGDVDLLEELIRDRRVVLNVRRSAIQTTLCNGNIESHIPLPPRMLVALVDEG